MPDGTYTINVTFERNLSDDANVIGKTPDDVTDDELKAQFIKELQEAYDETAMAGMFQVTGISRRMT